VDEKSQIQALDRTAPRTWPTLTGVQSAVVVSITRAFFGSGGSVSLGFGPDGRRLRRRVSGRIKTQTKDKQSGRLVNGQLNGHLTGQSPGRSPIRHVSACDRRVPGCIPYLVRQGDGPSCLPAADPRLGVAEGKNLQADAYEQLGGPIQDRTVMKLPRNRRIIGKQGSASVA
jgi:hypothetical protein